MNATWNIEPVNPRNLSDAEFVALNEFLNILHKEELPDDPPLPLEDTIGRMRNIPDFVHVEAWRVTDPASGRLIGIGSADVTRVDTNRHIGEYYIQVLPEHRRRGIARYLLARVAEFARAESRTLLLTHTDSTVPSGEAFMRRIGARLGLSMHVNELRIAELDRDLLRQWIAAGERTSAEFDFGFWDGAYPEEQLPEIVDLFNVMNQQPRDTLEVEDFNVTPEILRQLERSWAARNGTHWTMYVRHQPSSHLAGFTDVTWYPNRPEILHQGNTGVWPQYRGKGLGRWLKAAMLEKVLRELPQVTKVRTGNAMSNAPMLKINTDLGFKPYLSSHTWQVEREKVEAYLRGDG